MEANTAKLKALAQVNEKYGLIGQYQNHSGNYLGAAIWDIQRILQQINSPYLGCQYDINHATYEASGSWQTGFELIVPYVKSIAIKDFLWEKQNGKWVKEGCPLGEGLVNWPKYLDMLKQHSLSTPITMHYEYPLGGAENGAKKLSISSQELLGAMKKDLVLFKQWWTDAKL